MPVLGIIHWDRGGVGMQIDKDSDVETERRKSARAPWHTPSLRALAASESELGVSTHPDTEGGS